MITDEQRSSSRLPFPSVQAVYTAAERWRDESLVGDRSLFSGRNIDPHAAQELVDHFIHHPDVGSGSFVEKLRSQLSNVSSDAVQLAGELLFVHYLIASTAFVKSSTKQATVDQVLGFRDDTAGIPDDLLEALRSGVAHAGQAFNNFRWKMFAFLIQFYRSIKELPVDQRREVLTDLNRLREVFSQLDQQTVWSQMYAVEHLLLPDQSPPVLNRGHRDRIVQHWPELGRDVTDVCAHLAPNVRYGRREGIMMYRAPYRLQWQDPDPAVQAYVRWAEKLLSTRDFHAEEVEYKLELVARLRQVFEMARRDEPVLDDLRPAMRGKFNLLDFRVVDQFLMWVEAAPDAFATALRAFDDAENVEAMDRFLALVPREGHLKGQGARISLGSVVLMAHDPLRFPPWRDTPARVTERLTNGYATQEAATEGERYAMFLERLDLILAVMQSSARPLENRLEAQSLAWMVAQEDRLSDWDEADVQAFDAWRTGKAVENRPPAPIAAQTPASRAEPSAADLRKVPRSVEDLARDLSFADSDVPWLEETIALVLEKGQLILQGPPGTGKTFIARQLGTFVAGSADRVRIVQFHPSYAYEDFVNGLRPDLEHPSQFTLAKGPLVELAEQARENPSEQHVLLIDEINRANVPAVFGELYYLLEYRDEEITMTYGGDKFSLPKNLVIIGTMNTADRSITALDSAMRRRFYVRDLRPGEPPLDGILREFLSTQAPDLMWLAKLLDEANTIVRDADQAVGPSHFMAAEPSERQARRAWENSVVPTLRETFYGMPSRLAGLDFDALKEKVTGQPSDDAAD